MTTLISITPELLSSIVGIALSLATSYIPGLAEYYQGLSPVFKRLVMLGLLATTVGLIYGLSCFGWIVFVACDKFSLWQLLTCLVQALVANQSTFLITPRRHPGSADRLAALDERIYAERMHFSL